MKVKTFSGSSLPEAIMKAKQEFGNNIILLESKETPANRTKTGNKVVQVTVSVDLAQQQSQKQVKAWSPPKLDKPIPETPLAAPLKKPAKSDDFNQVIQNILARKPKELDREKMILDELAQLKEQINQLSSTPEKNPDGILPAFYEEVKNVLIDKGVQEKLAISLLKRSYQISENGSDAGKQEIINSVKTEMKRLFKIYNFKRAASKKRSKVVLMVGTTGVGKTTSAMKLAAHQEVYGKKEVVIVSTDLYGPSEALKAFSKMNGTTVLEKKRVDELSVLVDSAQSDVVIIDTPGQSPFAPNYLKKLEEYVKAVKPSDIFLVLPMNADLKDLYLSSALYMLLKPSGIILTKFDETAQPGKVLSIINELNLPVLGFGDGKRIFIDFKMPNVDYVIDKIFESNRG